MEVQTDTTNNYLELLSTCCPLVVHLLPTCCPLVVHLLSTCQSASVSLRPWDAPSLWRASPEPHGIRHSAFDSIWLWLWHTLAMTLPIFVHVRLPWVVSVVSVFSVVCRFLFFCHFTWSPSGHLKWSEFQCVPPSSTEFHRSVRGLAIAGFQLDEATEISSRLFQTPQSWNMLKQFIQSWKGLDKD